MINSTQWTEARFKSFIISALRAASRRWPVKWKVFNDAFAGNMMNTKTGKMCKHYRCAICKGLFTSNEMVVDHVEPVVDPKKGFIDWNTYVTRMFCKEEGLQVICKKPCHADKTKRERVERKKHATG